MFKTLFDHKLRLDTEVEFTRDLGLRVERIAREEIDRAVAAGYNPREVAQIFMTAFDIAAARQIILARKKLEEGMQK